VHLPRPKRRPAIGERAPYILLFLLCFNVGVATINAMGVYNVEYTDKPIYAVQPNTGYGSQHIQEVAGCATYTYNSQTNSGGCTQSVGGAAASYTNILTFGDYIGGIFSVLQGFGVGLVIPGYFLHQLGLDIFIPIFSAGVYSCWFFFIIWLRTGKPT